MAACTSASRWEWMEWNGRARPARPGHADNNVKFAASGSPNKSWFYWEQAPHFSVAHETSARQPFAYTFRIIMTMIHARGQRDVVRLGHLNYSINGAVCRGESPCRWLEKWAWNMRVIGASDTHLSYVWGAPTTKNYSGNWPTTMICGTDSAHDAQAEGEERAEGKCQE